MAGANHLNLLAGACPRFGIFDAYLPACNFWKNAIVKSGNRSASFVSMNHFDDS
ncbi:hypothetical protein HX037_05250 [Ignatzschineria indica]|uniref:hypothetical protein n=1 Tax=Ignatzschineria indica TaxID=472583 RepID=UPI0025762528|nr:hypothetical protein [Ignatzschineria indica]MDM1545289.1 hypothetical protein [Ignatzschineria indica]